MSSGASFDFSKNSYDIQETGTGLVFTPHPLKKPSDLDKTITAVQQRIHQLPAEAISNAAAADVVAAAKKGTAVKVIPVSVQQHLGVSSLLKDETKQLLECAKALSAYLGTIKESEKKLLLDNDIQALECLGQSTYSEADLHAIGSHLTRFSNDRITKDPLLNKLRDIFFAQLDGCMATNAKDAANLEKLIPLAKTLGKEFMAVAFTEGKRTVTLLRSDVPEAIQKIKLAFAGPKQDYSLKELLYLGSILNTLTHRLVDADPFLRAQKELFLEKIESTVFEENPSDLIKMAEDFGPKYEVHQAEIGTKILYTLKNLTSPAAIVEKLDEMTQSKKTFTVKDLQLIVDQLFFLPSEMLKNDPFVKDIEATVARELERHALFHSKNKPEQEALYRLIKDFKKSDPSFTKLDFLTESTQFSPESLEAVKQRREREVPRISEIVEEWHRTEIPSKARAETALETGSNGKWILWHSDETQQCYVSVKKDGQVVHHQLLGIIADDKTESDWAMYQAITSLAERGMIPPF